MSDFLWTIGLAFANEQLILPLGIGYGFIEGLYRKQWKLVMWFVVLLISSAVISEEVLKPFFKVPRINNPLRYGFPSGHTQFATIFYGWLCYQLKLNSPHYLGPVYTIVTIGILAFAVTAIVHCGYHTWFDVMGGLVSGSIILFLGTRLTLS